MDKQFRQRVRQISKECYTNSEPGKLCGGLYTFKGPPLTLKCPDCINAFGHVGQLSTHLQCFHDAKYSKDTVQSTAVDIETEAITVQLSKQATGQESAKDDDTLPIELSVICTPVTNIQIAKVPFQWTPIPVYQKASTVVLLDTETPSGYSFNKGGIISLAAMHEADNFAKPWFTLDPQPYVLPQVVRVAEPHKWLMKCVLLTRITPSMVASAPTMQDTLVQFFSWASLGYQLKEVIFVAHNAGFDRSRLQAITQVMIPDLETRGTTVLWVDSMALLKPLVLLTSPNGRIIAKSSKLSTLIAHHLPEFDLKK
jgi:DNA polymerase III epsilon subunit-like protein